MRADRRHRPPSAPPPPTLNDEVGVLAATVVSVAASVATLVVGVILRMAG